MKQSIVRAAALVLLSGALAPANGQNREHQQQAAELRILQEQQAQLALSIAQLAQSLTESNKAFTSRLDQLSDRITKLFADQAQLIGPIAENARITRERSQEASTRIGELTEEIRALRRDVASLLARPLTPVPPVDPLDPNAPAVPTPSTAVPLTPVPSALGLSPEQAFNAARAAYASGQWDLAIEEFQTFLKFFAADPRADDAQQGIGDALYSASKFEEAIAAYNLVIRNYPKGDQVAWAYYKRAVVQRRVGRPDEARASYEMAVKLGGDDVVAIQAKQGLAGLERAAPAPQKP